MERCRYKWKSKKKNKRGCRLMMCARAFHSTLYNSPLKSVGVDSASSSESTSVYLLERGACFSCHYPGEVWGERVANGGNLGPLGEAERMGRKASLGSSGGTTISGVHSVPAAL